MFKTQIKSKVMNKHCKGPINVKDKVSLYGPGQALRAPVT
jgi:hypothetical protein